MTRLLSVARERGREAWYLGAALARLRKGDMQRLTWADVNFVESTITIRTGKAKRVDVIPMHPQLADALRRRFQASPAVPTARVWSDTVGDVTRLKDFLRAGIARRVQVLDADGNPVMVGEGEHAKPKTRIVVEDDEGRVIDLHDYRTTLKHYTVLGLTDTAAAMDRVPGIAREGQESRATGTADSAPRDPQRYCQQLGRETARNSASWRVGPGRNVGRRKTEKPQQSPGFSRDSASVS